MMNFNKNDVDSDIQIDRVLLEFSDDELFIRIWCN
jgi:hypothetical protein